MSPNYRFLKYILLITVIVPFAIRLSAQKLKMDQVSLAYFAPLAVDPGAKVGVGFSFREWNRTRDNKNGDSKTYNHKLYLQPQLAYFSKWRLYSSFLANVEAVWEIKKEGKRFYSGFGVGLGYMHRREVLTLRTHFDGSTEVVETEVRKYCLPTMNYQLEMKLYSGLDLFSKIHWGYQISSKYISEGAVMLEIGLHFKLANKVNTNE